VVDSQPRVNGVHNLRIADSTIMPRIVAVPTMPACVLIGLRLAEMLVGRGSPSGSGSSDRHKPVRT
jgi:choline dehydrogenase